MYSIQTLAVLAIGVTALMLVGTASASPPLRGTVTVTQTSDVIVSLRQAGGNTIFTDVATFSFTGAITGTSTVTFFNVFHADGSGEIHGTGVSTGTWAGCGSEPVTTRFTIEFRVLASGDFTGTIVSIAGSPITSIGKFQGSIFDPVTIQTVTYRC